jgi:cell division protein FtsB
MVTDPQPAENAQCRRIRELEEQGRFQRFEIECLNETNKKLSYRVQWLEERCADAGDGQAAIDAANEADARCARKLYLLEEANRELDAENEVISKECDELRLKISELESVCDKQKAIIQKILEITKDGE